MCGIVGVIYDKVPAAEDVYISLINLQHRGKEAAGIVTYNGQRYYQCIGAGEVAQVISSVASLKALKGHVAVGQTRYSTTGGSVDKVNWQPMRGRFRNWAFFVLHNGNLVNLNSDNCDAKQCGVSDTFMFVRKVERSRRRDFIEAVIEVVKTLEGSFCFIILYAGKLIVIKDRFGFCPLVLGKKNGGYIVASETCALDMVGATFKRDILPGELSIISADKIETIQWAENTELKFSLFEFIYFLRPDSIIFGVQVGQARKFIGRRLARKYGQPNRMVFPVPDSANHLALGYISEITRSYPDINYDPYAFFRSHSVGRTFIEPIHKDKKKAQRQKFNTCWPDFRGIKEVVVLDDSLIRAKVIKSRIADLKKIKTVAETYLKRPADEYGIEKIHFLIGSPPYKFGDYYGVDTYRKDEKLIIRDLGGDIAKLTKHLGITSLAYADLNEDVIAGVLDAQEFLGISDFFTPDSFYTGPFSGEYPDGIGVYAD